MGLLVLGGCLPEETVTIYPSNGSGNVPVNAMVTVYIKASANVTAKDIRSNFFQMSTCEKTNSTESSSTSSDSTEQKDEKKEEEKKTTTTGTKVNFYTEIVEHAEAIEEGPEGAKQTGLLIYLIPEALANSDTALHPDTTYCVKSRPFKNKDGKKIAGAETKFTTESVASVLFSEQIDIDIKQNKVASNSDYIVLHFEEDAVDPGELKTNTTLCQQNAKQDSDGPCEYYGKKVEYELFMFEDLIRPEEDKHHTFEANLFTITPRGEDAFVEEFKIVINPSIGSAEEPDVGNIEKTIRVDENKHGAEHLEAVTQAGQTDTYYQSFRIGVKSK